MNFYKHRCLCNGESFGIFSGDFIPLYIPLQVVFGKIKLMKGETLPVLVKSLIVHAMME